MAAHPIQVLRHKCAFTHAQNKERNLKAHVFRKSTCSFDLFLQNRKWACALDTRRSSLEIGRVRWLTNVEELREASGGHRVMSAKKTLSVFTWSTKKWRAGERKDVLCNCPLSLSLSYTHSHTNPHDLFVSEHENTKSSFLNNNKKWPLFHTSW